MAVLGLLALWVPSPARAAEPPTLGGSLGASEAIVRVVSSATVPVAVNLSLTDGWSVEVPAFTLAPGEARNIQVTERGPEPGVVVATLRAVEVVGGTEAASLVLATGMTPPGADFGLLLWMLAIVAMAATSAVIAHRRMRRVAT